jgi:hypothetical protein
MLKRSRILLLATFAIVLVTMAPASAIFAGQGQAPENLVAENIVNIAQNANVQVKSLIDTVYEDDAALQKISDANLIVQLEGNVSLYNQGAVLLTEAESALETEDYSFAVSSAREALQDFRQVFKSINWILVDAGVKTGHEVDASGLLDAISRTLNRIERLREIVPSDATDQIALLDEAEALLDLDEAQSLIFEGKISVVADNLSEAKELVSQVYQYLKIVAEDSNTVRIRGYLQEIEQARERLRERFRYAGGEGLDVNGVFELAGYHNETEFMSALQNITQDAEGKVGNLSAVLGDLEALGQMVQQMDQTLTQEMNRYRGQHGSGNSGSGNGESGSESPGTSSGTGSSGSGYGSGNAGASGSGTDSGYGSGAGTGSPATGTSGGETGSGSDGTSGTGTTSGGNGYMGPGTSGAGSGSPSGAGGSGSGAGGNGP